MSFFRGYTLEKLQQGIGADMIVLWVAIHTFAAYFSGQLLAVCIHHNKDQGMLRIIGILLVKIPVLVIRGIYQNIYKVALDLRDNFWVCRQNLVHDMTPATALSTGLYQNQLAGLPGNF